MLIPAKLMNPKAINPVRINVIPNPFKGLGTFEYSSFSRTAAMPTIASNHPIPEPKPLSSSNAYVSKFALLHKQRST